MLMLAKNPYSFGLASLVLFFTREELSVSLLFLSTKSDRGCLEQAIVS